MPEAPREGLRKENAEDLFPKGNLSVEDPWKGSVEGLLLRESLSAEDLRKQGQADKEGLPAHLRLHQGQGAQDRRRQGVRLQRENPSRPVLPGRMWNGNRKTSLPGMMMNRTFLLSI